VIYNKIFILVENRIATKTYVAGSILKIKAVHSSISFFDT
jgi:hypothetical protein